LSEFSLLLLAANHRTTPLLLTEDTGFPARLDTPGLSRVFGMGRLSSLGRLFGRLLPILKLADPVGHLDSLVVQNLLDEGLDPLVELRVHSVVATFLLISGGLLSDPNVFAALALSWHDEQEVEVDFLEVLKAIEVGGEQVAVDFWQRLHFDLERVVGQ
jgi:hypothetical protein